MTDPNDKIVQFNRHLDELLRGESPVQFDLEEQELINVAQKLAQLDLSTESKNLSILRERILTNSPMQIAVERRRVLAGSVATILICLLAVMTVPPLKNLAQDIIGRIGNLIITDAPTRLELARDGTPTSTPRPRPTGTPPGESFIGLSYNEIDSLLHFPIYRPQYVPEGFEFCCFSGNFFGETPDHAVAFYSREAGYHDDLLNIFQEPLDETGALREFAVGDATIEDIEVNGNVGLWVGEALVGQRWTPDGEHSYVTFNYLYWEQDGYLFSLQSDVLSQEEMLRIAESMLPADE